MTFIRQPGKINKNTTLIDVEWMRVPGILSIYLIESEESGRKCLIDGGTATEARRLFKKLENLDAFPPDMILITHSHFDHTQAIPFFLKKAKKLGKEIEIMASKKAIPFLEDQSYNKIYGPFGPFKNIENVIPLKDGDKVNLEEISLKIIDIPGHALDHIAIFDERNKNIFVGDGIVSSVDENLILPPIVPPHWDTNAYLSSLDKIKKINYNSMSIAHFGHIINSEPINILDQVKSVFITLWNLFEENIEKLDDSSFMLDIIIKEIIIPQYGNVDFSTFSTSENVLLESVLDWYIQGFKMSKGI